MVGVVISVIGVAVVVLVSAYILWRRGLKQRARQAKASRDKGVAVMQAFRWNKATRYFTAAAKTASGTELVNLHNLIDECHIITG